MSGTRKSPSDWPAADRHRRPRARLHVLGVGEQDPRLADRAGHRIEGVGADRAIAAGVLAEEGDGLFLAVSGEGQIGCGSTGADLSTSRRFWISMNRLGSSSANSSSRTWPTPGAKYLNAPTPGSRLEVSRILTHVVEGAELGLDAEPGRDHLALVHGHARVELLEVAVARHRVGAHDPARRGAVHAGLPRSVEVGPGEFAFVVVVVVRGDLAHVPDVAVIVLRVPVEGVLDQDAVLIGGVADDQRLDAGDRLGLERREVVVALALLLAGLRVDDLGAVAVDRARRQREEGIVDMGWIGERRLFQVGKNGHGAPLRSKSLSRAREEPLRPLQPTSPCLIGVVLLTNW